MPDVGEVRYKVAVDNKAADSQIDETEKKIKKIGDAAEKTSEKIQSSSEKAHKKVKSGTDDSSAGLKKSADEAKSFSDALGKVPDGPIGKLNSSIKESEDALKDVNSALEKMPRSIGLATEKYRLTRDEISDTKDKLKELEKAQKEAKEAFKAGDVSENTYRAISREVLETKADLKELKSEGKEAFKDLANTGAAVTGISKIGSAAKTAGSVGLKALKGIGTAFVGLASAAGAGVAAVAKMGIEYNAQMQTYQTAFTTMLNGDTDKAAALTDSLKTLAAETPLAMTDLADASQTLLAFGSTAEQIPDQLKRLGDVAQGDAQKLGTMATAFGRIQSNGRASLEEINMMIDQGFNPLSIIAEKTGESMEEVRDRVSAGKVSFEEISEALQTATNDGGQFYNAMKNQSQTFEGQMSTLKDNVSALTGELTSDLFAGLAENALPQVNEWVDTLLSAAQEGGVQGAVDASGVILSEALTALLDGAPAFIQTANDLVGSFLGAVEANGPQITDGAINVILTLVNGFVDMIPSLISTAGTLIASLISGIADHFPEIVDTAVRLISNLASGLLKALPNIISAIGKLISAMVEAIFKTDWLQVGKDIILGLINGIGAMAGALWDAAVNIARSALDGIKSFFGIASPSKVMRDQVGKQLDAGIVVGMEDAQDEAISSAKQVSRNILGAFTADVNYNIPDMQDITRDLTANIIGTKGNGATIEVPLYLEGREIARASAWYVGEQLAWEER